MKKIGTAQVLRDFLWQGNMFPKRKIKLVNGAIEIEQQDQLDYLMKFQNWLIEQQKEEE